MFIYVASVIQRLSSYLDKKWQYCRFENQNLLHSRTARGSLDEGRRKTSLFFESLRIPWNIWTKPPTLPSLHQLKCFNSEKSPKMKDCIAN